MAQSKTEIANFAISHLGIGKRIVSLETERSQEAIVCNLFYSTALGETLRDFDWPFTRTIADLVLVQVNPNLDWKYSYRLPSDCLKALHILSGLRVETRQSRIEYEIGQDDEGKLLFTDQDSATLKYIIKADDPMQYPDDFTMALSYRLAMYVAPQITSGDRAKLRAEMAQYYMAEITQAKCNSLNEEQVNEDPESEFIRIREGVSIFDTSEIFRGGTFE